MRLTQAFFSVNCFISQRSALTYTCIDQLQMTTAFELGNAHQFAMLTKVTTLEQRISHTVRNDEMSPFFSSDLESRQKVTNLK
jgi:hypothetical protein